VLCVSLLQFSLCSLSSTQFFHTTYCSENECYIHVHYPRRYLKMYVFTYTCPYYYINNLLLYNPTHALFTL
jgi:hypothetical protein